MKLITCITSHFITTIEDKMVKKAHNTDSNGTPFLKFKTLKDIYKAEDSMLNDLSKISSENKHTNIPFADRKTKSRNSYLLEEQQPESPSNEDSLDNLTLSQLVKKSRKKKRKASESVVTSNSDYDDSDLSEPLFKFRVKSLKPLNKKIPDNESLLAIVNVKVEDPEIDDFESRENFHTGDVPFVCNDPVIFIASESGPIFVKPKSENSESFTNEEEICRFNDLDDTKNMVLDNEENISNNNQSPLIENFMEDDSLVEDLTTTTSDCSQSQPTLEEVNLISVVQDSKNADMDLNSLNSDNVSLVVTDIPIIQEQSSFLPDNSNSEVNFSDKKNKIDIKIETSSCIKPMCTERLPSTRKAISPTSQEKLCLAMKSSELLDDIDHYKCKEKLSFEEKPDNKFSSTTSENKAVINTPKITVKKQRSYKKGSPPKKGLLDGPRLCRSLPRLSTGCTTVQGCSESAIAFSQRQMHDIESLASKLMTELNSMKVIVEEKLLFEAYRSSTSLKNEADEVKSAIKSATKTEETAKKWLSMMARDCNRFCKIMKLNEDNNGSDSGENAVVIEEKVSVHRERKKISFADEVGGTLCDIKVYEIDQSSLELKQDEEL